MKHLFVSHNLAALLKEKGFNECCMCYYTNDSDELHLVPLEIGERGPLIGECNSDFESLNHLTAAPIYQQVIDWLYHPHGIVVAYAYETDLWTVSKDRKLLHETNEQAGAIEKALTFI